MSGICALAKNRYLLGCDRSHFRALRIFRAHSAPCSLLPAPQVHNVTTYARRLGRFSAVLLTLTGTFGQLVDYVTFGDWIFFELTAAALFVYRRGDQNPTPGFRVPAYPATVIIFVLAAAYVVFSSIVSNPRNAAIVAGLIGLGIPAFLYWRSRP